MDVIDRAVERGLHITENTKFRNQTWSDFETDSLHKKVFVFGVGAITRYFWLRYDSGEIVLEGILDNDLKKQGRYLSEYLGDICGQELMISSPHVLEEYPVNNVVVLIASSKYYEDIFHELKKVGIERCYSLIHLEYNERKLTKQADGNTIEDEFEKWTEYAGECIRKNPVDVRKVVFCGFGTYSDHGKYITEQLLKKKEQLDIVWVVSDLSAIVPDRVRLINSGDITKYIYEMETAKVWIISTMVPQYIIKRAQQIYIHTKHWSSITLKKFFLDVPALKNIEGNRSWWMQNAEMMDYIIVGSEFDAASCRKGLSSSAQMLYLGSPRSDALFQAVNYKEKICSFYDLSYDRPILLYAPTYRFRKNGSKEIHIMGEIDMDFQRVRRALKDYSGKEWYILLRLHPGVAIESSKIAKQEGLIDASGYDDSQELVAACDVLISDFSSIMFEAAYVEKPVFLYAPDKDIYTKEDYELLLDYDTLPFPVSVTNEELEQEIVEFDQDNYKGMVRSFLNQYGVHEDGHASERAAEFVLKCLHEKE